MCGQAHDGIANMLGKNSGVGEQLKQEFQKALCLHCLGHCINLAIKSVNLVSRGMKDCIDVCFEILKLIKHSPKRETALEQLKIENCVKSAENMEEDADNNIAPGKIKKFSKTR